VPLRDIVVIGASTGGLQALGELVRGLPADLPAPLFVVIHGSGSQGDVLAGILERAGVLPAQLARNGEPIQTGRRHGDGPGAGRRARRLHAPQRHPARARRSEARARNAEERSAVIREALLRDGVDQRISEQPL
jgi:two-component system chemotaxis response regulator CheB